MGNALIRRRFTQLLPPLPPFPTGDTTWSGASDSDLAIILKYADRNLIDLENDLGWAVGDARSVTIGSFTIPSSEYGYEYSHSSGQHWGQYTYGASCPFKLVLADKNYFDIVPQYSGEKTKDNFVVASDWAIQVNNVTAGNFINYGQTPETLTDTEVSFSSLVTHEILVQSFNALPATLKPIFKTIKYKANLVNKNTFSSTVVYKQDKFICPSVKETHGVSGYGQSEERQLLVYADGIIPRTESHLGATRDVFAYGGSVSTIAITMSTGSYNIRSIFENVGGASILAAI